MIPDQEVFAGTIALLQDLDVQSGFFVEKVFDIFSDFVQDPFLFRLLTSTWPVVASPLTSMLVPWIWFWNAVDRVVVNPLDDGGVDDPVRFMIRHFGTV